MQKTNTTHPVVQGPDDTVSLQLQSTQTSLDIILTPILNSVQIVAPEVVLCKYYGKPADVFSFSILLWEMLALSQPFKSYDYEKHAQLVVQKNKRPDLKKDWPVLIKNVISRAWAPDPNGRPSFHQICNSLSGEFADSSNGLSRTERLVNETHSSRELTLARSLPM